MAGRKDIITEEEFTRQMSSTLDPQQDSPGDSEADAGDEFMMGMSFEPGEEIDDELAENESDSDEVTPEPRAAQPTEKRRSRTMEDLPEFARGTSSNQPAPWTDIESSSDTN